MRHRTEKELLGEAAGGDSAAFGEIVRRYQQLVYAAAARITGDPSAAQDVAQEAFITAFSKLPELRSASAFPAWLRVIARNAAYAWLRERRRTVPLDDQADVEDPSGAPEEDVQRAADRTEGDAFRAGVKRAVSSLSDTLRFPVVLCYLNGVPTKEAARFLGISEGAVRKRLHDGRKKLQERIVRMAEKTLQEYRLPRDFAKRCICGCRRAQAARTRKSTGRR